MLLEPTVYASIYCLYNPSYFADPSYMRTGFNKKTFEATHTMKFLKEDYPGFYTIHARASFTTCTHVVSNPLLPQGDKRPSMVLKEQLCQSG
jgi:hypothetical protein